MNPIDENQFRNAQSDFINKRSEFLSRWVSSELEQATSYLLLTNSGGAVAVLSFLAAVPRYQSNRWLYTSLILFAAGIIFLGLFRSHEYERSEGIFLAWQDDVKKFISNPSFWNDLIKRDELRTKLSPWGRIFGYGSFICLVAGIVVGGIALAG